MFKNLKVIELASVLAGPAVGSFFAELGAEVIKIENPATGGDMTRRWFTEGEHEDEISAYFSSVNYQKADYLMKDLNDSDELQEVKDLIREADIVLSNFKASTSKRMGLDFESLKKINPKIISAEISGFPEDERPAFDVVLQAETGFISMTGSDRDHLAKMPVALIDVLAAHQVKEGIMISMLKQQKENKAYRVRVNLYETALASLANIASNYLMSGKIAEPIGTQHPNIAPYGDIFTCADGKKIVLAAGTEKQYKSIVSLFRAEQTLGRNQFSSNALRVKNRVELCQLLQKEISTFKRDAMMNTLLSKGIPAGAVRTVDEVLSTSEARKLIHSENIEGTATQRIKTAVFTVTS